MNLVQEMFHRMEAESSRVDLSVRFINWFTQRGEAYEHNIKIINNHLKQLTDDVHPSDRQPFTNRIRLTKEDVAWDD